MAIGGGGAEVEVELREEGDEAFPGHAAIPIAFRVDRILEPVPGGGPRDLEVREQADPWVKDYDGEAGASPASWSTSFDTSTWRVISAWHRGERVGGVVLLANLPGVEMLEGRLDLALIWDLRIAPEFRGRGVGSRLVSAAVEWARSQNCRELKVETQNINVSAFRFYESQGFELRSVNRGVYEHLPAELQMLLYRTVH